MTFESKGVNMEGIGSVTADVGPSLIASFAASMVRFRIQCRRATKRLPLSVMYSSVQSPCLRIGDQTPVNQRLLRVAFCGCKKRRGEG